MISPPTWLPAPPAISPPPPISPRSCIPQTAPAQRAPARSPLDGASPAGVVRAGEQGLALPLLSPVLAAAQVEVWLGGLLLLPAFAGPAGDVNKALLRVPSGRPWKNKNQAWKEVALRLYPPRSAGPGRMAHLRLLRTA